MAAVRHKLDSRHRSVRNTHLLKRSTLYSISCCAIPKICNPAGLLHQIATTHTRQSVRTENFSILFSRIERRVDPKEYIPANYRSDNQTKEQIQTRKTRDSKGGRRKNFSVRTENFSIVTKELREDPILKEYTHTYILQILQERNKNSKRRKRQTAREGGGKTTFTCSLSTTGIPDGTCEEEAMAICS